MAALRGDAGSQLAALLAPGNPWHVRLCAARVAIEAPSPLLVRPLVTMLGDDDPALGDAAMLALRSHQASQELATMLARLREAIGGRGSPPYWRRTAARTFGRLRDRGVVAALIGALSDDETIAAASREALRTITGRDLGAYRLPWLLWWRTNERRSRGEWLLDALDQGSAPLRARALAELVLVTGEDLGRRAPTVERDEVAALRAAYAPLLRASPGAGERG